MRLTGSLNGMGINLKNIRLLLTSAALILLGTAAIAAPVEISYQGAGTSTSLKTMTNGSVNAGLSAITVDGTNSLAVNTSNSTMAGTWSATANSYTDVRNGAGKYNRGRNGSEKYAKAGYLFSLLDNSESLSDTAAKFNALVNYVIWDIMGSVPELKDRREKKLVKALKKRADRNKRFDWSTTMEVYTSNDRGTTREFFAVLPPIATPIPSALFLFGSMALGLFGIVTRKQAAST